LNSSARDNQKQRQSKEKKRKTTESEEQDLKTPEGFRWFCKTKANIKTKAPVTEKDTTKAYDFCKDMTVETYKEKLKEGTQRLITRPWEEREGKRASNVFESKDLETALGKIQKNDRRIPMDIKI